MIDAHSHVLPQIDDGSRSVEDSLTMLHEMLRQGVTTVAATPHFYASESSPNAFFEKRQEAYEKLSGAVQELPMDIRLGAEVLYYEGLQRTPQLKQFCIEGTPLLLLEMPFAPWNERLLRGVEELSTESGLTLVMAHVDRYFPFQHMEVFERLAYRGVLMQLNADAFAYLRGRKKALYLVENGLVQFFGSDCHDPIHRAPNLNIAEAFLTKKLGSAFMEQLNERAEDLFRKKEAVV